MKYMGSKKYGLSNGLGKLLDRELPHAGRFVDPFAGSAAVVWHVAQKYNVPVLSSDLQTYSAVLARAVIGRTKPVDVPDLENNWIAPALAEFQADQNYKTARELRDRDAKSIKRTVADARTLCARQSAVGPVWNAYGGHYFSPYQALAFDYLLKSLPKSEPTRSAALAALIDAASACAAAPGHTAQPFQPTPTAKKFIHAYWKLDPFQRVRKCLADIADKSARQMGEARVADAMSIVKELRPTDLVFLDPPYSGVQYSRFYHVLETIARGHCGPVEGVGRYPKREERPQSKYSNTSQSTEELRMLMKGVAARGAKVIFTFPDRRCSNGLSGKKVKAILAEWFDLEDEYMSGGHFSTLGGTNLEGHRKHRKRSRELVLLLKPKSSNTAGERLDYTRSTCTPRYNRLYTF